MRIILVALSLVMLAGCSLLTPDPVIIDRVVYVEQDVEHPELPQPVSSYQPEWVVITKETIKSKPDNIVMVGLEWNESQQYRIWLEDVLRYIQQLQNVTCGYRQETEDFICERYKAEPETE